MEDKIMIVPTSQGNIEIEMPYLIPGHEEINLKLENVCVRMSGGADSTILAYILSIYKRDFRPDINLYALTCVNAKKPYQEDYAKKVIYKIQELTGIEFSKHLVAYIPGVNYAKEQGIESDKFMEEYNIGLHFNGETENPPLDAEKNWVFRGGGRDPSRDGKGSNKSMRIGRKPLRNIDKKGVKELYDYFNITDVLFPITRSCEMQIDNKRFKSFDEHCGECWFCLERLWGFGSYK
jgi:hypothetical protein